MGTSGDKIVLLDGMGSGSGSATNGLLSMIPGMFANLIGGNKMDPIMNQLNAAKRTSSDILDSIDKHRRTLEACDSILEEINPAFKQTKDQDRKIKNLEEKVDRMGSSFDELKELLIKKLG